MPGLKLFVSNRLEILVEKLAGELSTPLSSPLKKENVVVQSKGMERWLSMQLARYHGVCANVLFPFPNPMIDEIFRAVFPANPEDTLLGPSLLTWKIMKYLPACLDQPGFETLYAYAGTDRDPLKCYQIAEQIAHTFDQYLVFRPEMILKWEKGKDNHWQALLWRMIIQDEKASHRTAVREDFFKKIRTHIPDMKNLPERISVFGISSLPPFHMEIFAELSKIIPLSFFLMNPCREYWGGIVSDWEAKKLEKKSAKKAGPEILHLEKGNTLLASWGTLGKEFFDMVYNVEAFEHECFEEPEQKTLLSCLQADILLLRENDPEKKLNISASDTSFEIHSCHSPMREVEVLHDNLLTMFEEIPGLLPGDILVMAPDIEPYASYIQAVFDTPEEKTQQIPYTIADQSIKSESSVIKIFLSILDLEGSRFGATPIMTLLESPLVFQAFGLAEPDIEVIRRWVDQTGIRWGIDETTREKMGLPAFPENTWRFGLDRLMLGYALPGKEEKTFHGILPYDLVEDTSAPRLGGFLAFAEKLFISSASLEQFRTLHEWGVVLLDLLDAFIHGDEKTGREILFLRTIINGLASIQTKSGFDDKIGLPVIRSYLQTHCKKEGLGFGFMSGGVTFCTMLPMRSIPFKVICLLGMNNDAYPRESRHLSFDLIAKHPMPGDRSRRNDDRYLFLEAILSAREKLYISYVGQSIQDNSSVPPSVIVSELLDYVEQGFTPQGDKFRLSRQAAHLSFTPQGDKFRLSRQAAQLSFTIPDLRITEQLMTKHRLQAFSPEYFKTKGKLKSFSKDNFNAALIHGDAAKNPSAFISRGLSRPDEELKKIELSSLVNFFSNPARFFLNKRLGIFLEDTPLFLSDREPFDLKGLEKYDFEQKLLKKSLAEDNLMEYLASVKASGKIPPGMPGEYLYQQSREGVEKYAQTLRPFLTRAPLQQIEVNLKISDFTITGHIENICETGVIFYRYTRVKIKDRLNIWIYHLALNSIDCCPGPRKSMFIGENETIVLPPVQESPGILADLLQKYWDGLSKPLPFFPESSWEYARGVLEKNIPDAEAIAKARDIWEGGDFSRGEIQDPSFQLCFGKADPLDNNFRKVAREVLEPMIKSSVVSC